MLRTRLTVFAVTLALAAVLAATAPAAAQPFDFGTAELGEIKTFCILFCFGQNCSQSGVVSSLEADSPFFVRGIRLGPDDPAACSTSGATTPATLPVTVPQGQRLFFDIDLVGTELGNADGVLELNQQPLADLEASVVPATPCTPSSTSAICLNEERFKVRT